MTTKPPNHLDTLRKMLREERSSPFLVDGGPGHKRIAALRAAIAALEQPPVPAPAIKTIRVRLGGHVGSTRYEYLLHENGLVTRYTDKPTSFDTETASWKLEGDQLEIAFT